MTLIVARIDGGKVHVTGDTLLSKISGERLSYDQCVIKTVIINPQCCVCFAGNPDPASEAIAHLLEANYKSDNEILKYLAGVHEQYSQSTDFGVITNIDEVIKLHSLKSGEPKTNLPSFWLGDHFNNYQTKLASLSSDEPLKQKMKSAMESIIQDGNLASIGGFQVSLSSDNNSFQYEDEQGKRTISCLSYDFGIQHVLGPQTLEFKDVGEFKSISGVSDDNVSIFSSITPEYPGAAIHYKHANVGYLFCPHLRIAQNEPESVLESILFDDVSPNEFINQILEEHAIQLKGFVASDDGRITFIET